MMSDTALLASPTDLMMAKANPELRVEKDLQRLHAMGDNKYRMEKINETAQEFESVFMSQMLQHMFAGVEVDEEFGGGHGEEMFRSLLIDEYGKLMTKAGGIGLADHIRQEMLELQEVK